MYHNAYGIIETLAPLHVGATAGEETGNLNLIFRDQFTQTGIIPGSSIRGRFRADMRSRRLKLEADQKAGKTKELPIELNENIWYGHEAEKGKENSTTEALVKFEYASIIWLPVFCPNQVIVWVSCPRLLKRYQKLSEKSKNQKFTPYTYFGKKESSTLFFNLGFLKLNEEDTELKNFIPQNLSDLQSQENLVVLVDDSEISMIHEMALYRQSRVALGSEENPTEKIAKRKAFFNVEALPEGTVLAFPMALKKNEEQNISWENYLTVSAMLPMKELYFGGLESIGLGRTTVTLNSYEEEKKS
ncbi:MAG: RAMP superfamily CRISPR-associated protein [Phormidium sp.]